MTDPLAPGDVLRGFCGGAFGHMYGDKLVEGVGDDWVVARELDGPEAGRPALCIGVPDDLREYLA